MPRTDDLEISGFINFWDVALHHELAEFVLPLGKHIPILNEFYGHGVTIYETQGARLQPSSRWGVTMARHPGHKAKNDFSLFLKPCAFYLEPFF